MAFIWYNGLHLVQQPLSDVTAFTGQRPLSGASTFIWCINLYLVHQPLSGATASLWHKSLCNF
jgi:hypothetical protein